MRLLRLQINRLPGIRPGFSLTDFGPGINVITGPNASGKSSFARALRLALYPEESADGPVDIEAVFEDSGAVLRAVRLGSEHFWTQDGVRINAPALPEHRFAQCFTLHIEDLLDSSSATDLAISVRIRRALAGGYDIQTVQSDDRFALKRNHGKAERDQLRESELRLRQCIQEGLRLQDDEARLDSLRRTRCEAAMARDRTDCCNRALDFITCREEGRALADRRKTFPVGMELLAGNELTQLNEFARVSREIEADQVAALRKRDYADAEIVNSGLAEVAFDEAQLGDLRHMVQRLSILENRLDAKGAELARAIGERDARAAALGGKKPDSIRLDPESIRDVETALYNKRQLDNQIAQLSAERNHLSETPDPGIEAYKLRAARDELSRWLRCPGRGDRSGISIIGGLALFISALVAMVTLAVSSSWIWLIMLPVLIGGAVALFPLMRTANNEREQSVKRFSEHGIKPPNSWTLNNVAERVGELETDFRAATEYEHHRERIRVLENTIRSKEQERSLLLESLAHHAEVVGFNPETLDASVDRWIRLCVEFDRATAAHQGTLNEVTQLQHDANELLASLSAAMKTLLAAPLPDLPNADILGARLDDIAARLRKKVDASRAILEADAQIESCTKRREEHQAKMTSFFQRYGLPVSDGSGYMLRQRVERLEEWTELQAAIERNRAVQEQLRLQIQPDHELLSIAETANAADVQKILTELKSCSNALEPTIQEISRIENEIKRAQREQRIAAARAARQAAEDALGERLDEMLLAEAAQVILNCVSEEYIRVSQPQALHRAAEWFGRFTRHQFELDFAGDSELGFVARDLESGEIRSLEALSSGTRMQLLLAVRAAFALEVERGRKSLPFILDEALSTADPDRFQATAQALRILADDGGRQVFYLTAQPNDAAYWSHTSALVHCIDLAEVRSMQRAISDAAQLKVQKPSSVTISPDTSPEAYALAIRVPPIDLWADVGSIHLFHLLRDEISLLHRFITVGYSLVGPVQKLLDSSIIECIVEGNERERLRALMDGATVWLRCRRQGKGRPLDRHAIETSGCISAKFLERVIDLNQKVAGDGCALIAQLADGAIPRFQSEKRVQLETWLIDHGFITTNDELPNEEIGLRVANAILMHLDTSASEEAVLLAQSLVTNLNAGLQAQRSSQPCLTVPIEAI